MVDGIGGFPGVAETISKVEAIVRAEDRDRYVATLFAPAVARPQLFALHAFDLALAEVVRTTTEPQIGMIRLAWWRDSVERGREKPIAGEPVLAAVAAAALDIGALAALAEAHMDVLDGAAGVWRLPFLCLMRCVSRPRSGRLPRLQLSLDATLPESANRAARPGGSSLFCGMCSPADCDSASVTSPKRTR